MLFSVIPNAQAELWELLIDLNVQKAVNSGEIVIVTGKVVDQAYKPIRGAEVFVRAGSETIKVFTDPWGVFKVEFKESQRIPGTYTVNVIASWYGMTGLSSTQFQVKGDISPVLILQERLDTEQARKYLSSNEEDFEKNPIGQTLFKYYHGLHDELILELKEAREPLVEQIHIDQQREIAEDLKNQAINDRQPSAGIFEGTQYENYVRSLNPEIKDLIVSQLNFTKNLFEEGQKIRNEVLANGGTYEEARKAYLDKISISKETLEQFNQNDLDEKIENNADVEKINEEDSENE